MSQACLLHDDTDLSIKLVWPLDSEADPLDVEGSRMMMWLERDAEVIKMAQENRSLGPQIVVHCQPRSTNPPGLPNAGHATTSDGLIAAG